MRKTNDDYLKNLKSELDKGNNLIDYFITIGIGEDLIFNKFIYDNDLNTLNNSELIKPEILTKFPPIEKKNVIVDENIIRHCFPNGFNLIESTETPQKSSFYFVLDNNHSSIEYPQKFICCLLFYEKLDNYKKAFIKYTNDIDSKYSSYHNFGKIKQKRESDLNSINEYEIYHTNSTNFNNNNSFNFQNHNMTINNSQKFETEADLNNINESGIFTKKHKKNNSVGVVSVNSNNSDNSFKNNNNNNINYKQKDIDGDNDLDYNDLKGNPFISNRYSEKKKESCKEPNLSEEFNNLKLSEISIPNSNQNKRQDLRLHSNSLSVTNYQYTENFQDINNFNTNIKTPKDQSKNINPFFPPKRPSNLHINFQYQTNNNTNLESNPNMNVMHSLRSSYSSVTTISGTKRKFKSTIYVPKCICLVSVHPFCNDLLSILDSIYNYTASNTKLKRPLEKIIENLVIEIPLPPRGIYSIQYELFEKIFLFKNSKTNELPYISFDLEQIFFILEIDQVLEIFKHLMLETRLIFFSKEMHLLSPIIHGFVTLLYPFKYPFNYITVIPEENFMILENVTPFVIGINQSYSSDFFTKNNIDITNINFFVIDIDNKKTELFCYEANNKDEFTKAKIIKREFPNLPEHYKKKLSEKIKEYYSSIKSSNRKSSCKRNSTKETNSNFVKNMRNYFYQFMISIFLNYAKYLNLDYYNNKNMMFSIPSVGNLFKVEEFLNTVNNIDKPFYRRFIKDTQQFADFIYRRMIPKDSKDKLEILLFDEHISEKNNRNYFSKKTPIYFINSDLYDFKNIYYVEKQRSMELNEKKYFMEYENRKKALKFGQEISCEKNGDITISYFYFPTLMTNFYFENNLKNYILPINFSDQLEQIDIEMVSNSHLGVIEMKETIMENYIYLCWAQLWAGTFWYHDEIEKQFRFNQLLIVLDKLTHYEIEIFNLLFESINKYGNENMIFDLYIRMLETYKVLPTYSICTIYNRIIDKKNNRKYQNQIKRNTITATQDNLQSESHTPNDLNQSKYILNNNNNKVINKLLFRKRTIKSKYDDSEISDNYEFLKTYPCVECLDKIYLLDICKNFKDMSKDLEWALCQNCNTKILPKLRIKYNFEENNSNLHTKRNSDNARKFSASTSTLSEHHNCHESEVLNSPFHLKYNFYNSSFIESRLKLDVEYFKIKFNAIFWNSIWYFKLKNLPVDFIFPYLEEKNDKPTPTPLPKELNKQIKIQDVNKDISKNNNNYSDNILKEKEKELNLRDSTKIYKFNDNLNDKDSNPFSFGNNNNKIKNNEITNTNNNFNYEIYENLIIKNDNEKEDSNLKNLLNKNENKNEIKSKDLQIQNNKDSIASNNLIENFKNNKKFNSIENLEIVEDYNFSSLRTFENLENSDFDMEINKEITEENNTEKVKEISLNNNSVAIASSNLGSNYIKELNQINENEEEDYLNTYKELKDYAKLLDKNNPIGNIHSNPYQNINNINNSENVKNINEINNKNVSKSGKIKTSEIDNNFIGKKEDKDSNGNFNYHKTQGSHKSQRSYDFSQFNKINFNNFNLDISQAFESIKEDNSNIKEPYKFITTPKENRKIFPFDKNDKQSLLKTNSNIITNDKNNSNLKKNDSSNNIIYNSYIDSNLNSNKNSTYGNNSNSNEEKINISNKKLQSININSFEVKKHFQSKSEINVFNVQNENKESHNDFNTNSNTNTITNINKNFNLNLNFKLDINQNSIKNKNLIVMSLTPKRHNSQNLTLENFFKKDNNNNNNNNNLNTNKIEINNKDKYNCNENENEYQEEKNIFNKIQKEKLDYESNFNNNNNNNNDKSKRINKLYEFTPQIKLNLSKNDINNNNNNNLNDNKINNEYDDLKSGNKNISLNCLENNINKINNLNNTNFITIRPINLNLKNSKMNIHLNDSNNSIEEINDENLNKKCITSRNSIATNYAKINGSAMNLLINNRRNTDININKINFNKGGKNSSLTNTFNPLNSNEKNYMITNNDKFSLDNINTFSDINNPLNKKSIMILNNDNNSNAILKSENLSKSYTLENNTLNSNLYEKEFNYQQNKDKEIDTNYFSLNKDDLINDNINHIDINISSNKCKINLNMNDSRKSSINKKLNIINEEEENNQLENNNFNLKEISKENYINNKKINNIKSDLIEDNIDKNKNKIGLALNKNKNYMRYSSFNIKDILIEKEKLEISNLDSRFYTQEPEEFHYSINEDNELSRITSKSDKIVDIFSSNKKKKKSDLDNNNNYNGNKTPNKLDNDEANQVELNKRFSSVKDIIKNNLNTNFNKQN